jgi:hypothetical protein
MASMLVMSMSLGALIVQEGLVCGRSVSLSGAGTWEEAVPTAIMAVRELAALSVSHSELNLLTITDALQALPLQR